MVYISISAVTATNGSALTACHFFRRQKVTKRLAPSVRHLAKARRSLAPAFIRGHRPPVGCASTSMRCPRLRRGALRASPLMNTSTRPAEGAGRSKARAKAKAKAKAKATATATARSTARSTASRAGSLPHGSACSFRFSPLNRPSVSSPAAFDLDAPPPREAEWRFCAVGNPAWMPG